MNFAIRTKTAYMCVVCALLLSSQAGLAQSTSGDPAPDRDEIAIGTLISTVAQRTGKKLVVDPRVRANVALVGVTPQTISYAEFLTVLQVHGFTLIEAEDFARVVPDAGVRQLPSPIARGKEKRSDAEYVTRVIQVRNVPARTLVPLLRPLLPQQAHFAAAVCTNQLVIVDTVANVRRIEALVQALDLGERFEAEKCVAGSDEGKS